MFKFSYPLCIRIFSTLLLVLFVGHSAQAQTSFEQEFMAWAKDADIAKASVFAIDKAGNSLADRSIGGENLAMPIASISKSIAGQCAMYMVAQKQISLGMTLSGLLGWNAPNGDITISQLLTHTSGLNVDLTQKDVFGRSLRNERRIADILEKVEMRQIQEPDRNSYFYNNENYLILERAMAKAVNTRDIATWCFENVPSLNELRSLQQSDVSFALGFAGGMEMNARDLANFFGSLVVKSDWPQIKVSGNNSYGPGIFIQAVSNGVNLFHLGGICTVAGQNFGAYGARLANGKSVGFLYSGCPSAKQIASLNTLVLKYLN